AVRAPSIISNHFSTAMRLPGSSITALSHRDWRMRLVWSGLPDPRVFLWGISPAPEIPLGNFPHPLHLSFPTHSPGLFQECPDLPAFAAARCCWHGTSNAGMQSTRIRGIL